MNTYQEIYNVCKGLKEELCCTCLKKNFATIKITDLDYDGRTFLEKMIACVCPTLEVYHENIPQICRVCVTTLNLAFKFRRTALNSLQILNFATAKVVDNQDNESVNVGEESTDDHVSFSNDDDFDTIELDKAVLSISDLNDKGQNENRSEQFSCKECSSFFKERDEYEDHMVQIHHKKLECELCRKTFKTWYRLKEHIASHSREKNFTCTHCSKTFTRISSLKRHMTTHYAPPGQKSKKTPFLCMICGKNFPFSNGAARHMRIHFGIKTHHCQICNKQFNQSTHLQVHMRTHSGEKPYICEICGDSFTLKAGLHKHMKSKHEQEQGNKLVLNNAFN